MRGRPKPFPSQAALSELLHYDPHDGVLYWRERKTDSKHWNRRYANKPAGYVGTDGYIRISVFDRMCLAHRIIWFLIYGNMPVEIDHINGRRSDNRLENLRVVTRTENTQNAGIRSDNSSGHAGVSWSRISKKWHVYINIGRRHNIGHFDRLDDAIAARKAAEIEFGFHANDRRGAA